MVQNANALNDLKKFIVKNESGQDYNIYNFGASGKEGIRTSTPGTKYYTKNAEILTSLTVKQVLIKQRDSEGKNPLGKGDLFAVGKYQIIPKTLYSIANTLNVLDQLFDQTTQEKLGDYLILDKRSSTTGKYVRGNNAGNQKNLEDAVQGMAQEFASLPAMTLKPEKGSTVVGNVVTGVGNSGYYGGDGNNPDVVKISIKDMVRILMKARIEYSGKNPEFIPSYCSDIKLAPSPQTKISGKVTDEKGQPLAGVAVKAEPPKPIKLSEPIKNPTTGKYEVKDQDGNVIADSLDGEVARRQASDIILNKNKQQSVNNPAPPSSTTPTTQGHPNTPFKTSAESDDFRKWILNKYPSYGTQTGKYKIDPPPQPNYINTDALKKAWSEKGTEYNIINLKFDSSKEMDPSGVEEPVTVITDKDGNWEMIAPSTYDPKNSTITFSKEGHKIREVTNIQQTGGDIAGGENKQYALPRITVSKTPDITGTATNQLNQEILTEETKLIKQQGNSELSAQERLANSANNKKEELKKTAIPFIIKLLAPFGAVALQAVISKIPLDKIKNQIQCPSQAKILELTNKRNKLVRQVNNAYKTINTLTKTLSATSIAITAIQAGITVIEALPYPATGVPPIGLPPLTSGIIEVTGSGKDKLKEALKKANVVISIVTLSLAAFGAILGIILRLLNNLDALIQQCAQEQDVPFEDINNELNTFINQSTGISNSEVIQSTQENNTYKGFTLEIKLDETNSIKYPRRFAQALTKTGIPVLKTDSSFASDPQVLLDQLKFIIDSNPQLTAE